MKVSVNWLRALSGVVDADSAAIAGRLTGAGLEVEGEEAVGLFTGVVVAEVRARRPHPKADKLSLVDVFDGREVTQVVCGASNVPPPGGRVAWARPGARLPGGMTLEPRDVRGVMSPGMLCAEDELGLGASHEGILILDGSLDPGSDLAATLGLPDVIFELNVTPNRPDCLGHIGVAREVAALFGVQWPAQESGRRFDRTSPWLVAMTGAAPYAFPSLNLDERAFARSDRRAESLASVEIADVHGCSRYLARIIENVKVGPSPLVVQSRLKSLGLRSINNVVDATNLVLLESGQPLHAFDLDKIRGARIVVRRALEGEAIITLDGQERRLVAEDIAICDAEGPVAVAGVMGGRDSEVSQSTTRILLESAWFEPSRIRRTARRLGLHSEASHRFERGVDPVGGVRFASDTCTWDLTEWASGQMASGAIDVVSRPAVAVAVTLRPRRTDELLGVQTASHVQVALLGAIGISAAAQPAVAANRDEVIECKVPTFRPDLTREIDLIEEIARLRGYDSVPATLPRTSAAPGAGRRLGVDRKEPARDILVALGFAEAITYAFVGPDRLRALGHEGAGPHAWRSRPLRIENPLREELSALRTSAIPGLLVSLERNRAHGVDEVRLFEVGAIFRRRHAATCRPEVHLPERGRDELLPEERRIVAGVMTGRRAGWLKPGEEIDFFDVKGIVAALLDGLRIGSMRYRAPQPGSAGEAPWLHPGQSAVLVADWSLDQGREGAGIPAGAVAGVLGEVHPDVRALFGLETRTLAFEIDLDALGASKPVTFQEAPRFPGSARDISFFVERSVPAADLQAAMLAAAPLLESVRVLEDYREPGKVPAGKKGMLFSLSYRSRERTLTDDGVTREHERVLEALRTRFHIEQR